MARPGEDPRDTPPSEDIRPIVALPRSDLPTPVLIAIGLTLALALFLFLNARRTAEVQRDNGRSGSFRVQAPPPQLQIPPSPPEAFAQPPVIIYESAPESANPTPPAPTVSQPTPLAGEEPMTPPRSSPDASGPQSNEPAMVIDMTSGSGVAVNAASSGDATAAASDSDAARASIIRNRASLIPQGAIIAAVLETPLNSDRPGMARAIVSHDARSFDGSRVLIPRGSRLIGEFKSDANPSQRRVLVTWTRLIRPDGVAIRIGSPAADALGGAGLAGRVNTHFFERFASAVLQSALTIGVNIASQVNANPNSVYVGLPSQASQIGQQLMPNSSRPSTVKVREGSQIAILVARDLDFGGTPAVR